MPRWGQLGCSGFIVLDSDKRVVSKCTTAFLQMKNLAFSHVEALLDALLTGSPVPKVCPGQCVLLEDKDKKRGQQQSMGVVLDAGDPDECSVFMLNTRAGRDGASMVRVARDKLRVIQQGLDLPPQTLLLVEQARKVVASAAVHTQQAQGSAPILRGTVENSEQGRKRSAAKEDNAACETTAEELQVHVASVLNVELDRQVSAMYTKHARRASSSPIRQFFDVVMRSTKSVLRRCKLSLRSAQQGLLRWHATQSSFTLNMSSSYSTSTSTWIARLRPTEVGAVSMLTATCAPLITATTIA